jgi:glyceraldehyde 3-phosphate dehydrogenase
MKISAYLNGFGRFGLHLLSYYLERNRESSFTLKCINDEVLTVEQIIKIIHNDRYIRILDNWKLLAKSNTIILKQGEKSIELEISNLPLSHYISNKKGILLECSGNYTNTSNFPNSDSLKRVYISATSLNADRTLIVGVNELDYLKTDKFISYGSCTVNAFIPVASTLHKNFKVVNSDVNVIHNIPEYRLREVPNIFERRDCTLSFMAPNLLNFITPENFKVNYTVVPITGVSRMDFRFNLQKSFNFNSILKCLESIKANAGHALYKIHETDPGQYAPLLSNYSAEFVLEQCSIAGKNLYLSAYFDTENSVNRYYDLIQSIEKEGQISEG